ncbi:putative colanic acid biosynthesis acetyltransferase WcaF [Salinibacter ruber]|uniref:WcaF family extracellular polysaccharide biosynthesis acetyltransferase n=1 Tax=Salinibacter ruber TaxID=146919 RepID=UPI0016176D29|nr:WcaF family extracellular polysaccharide biosynthesis acetyltransferase [Salinibacter ruber]MBB4070367.1 putative colanic acid biosynthesis acetyltransferase WcaF [Salinibacter ruber]
MADPDLDIAANRSARRYEPMDLIRRVLWGVGAVLFRWTPRLLYGLRNALLRLFGAEVGRNVRIHPRATIYFPWNLSIGDWSSVGEDALIYNLGSIAIGEQVTISQRAHLCAGTHDATDPAMPLKKPPIAVGDQAWVCADAFVGPDVTVGEGAVVGARAVAVGDVDAWTIVGGNPARKIKRRTLDADHSP